MPEPTPCPSPAAQGLVCVSAKLRLAERRQQRLQEVRTKHRRLCEELAETQGRLMVEPGRWLEQCESPRPPAGVVRPAREVQACRTPAPMPCPAPLPTLCLPSYFLPSWSPSCSP